MHAIVQFYLLVNYYTKYYTRAYRFSLVTILYYRNLDPTDVYKIGISWTKLDSAIFMRVTDNSKGFVFSQYHYDVEHYSFERCVLFRFEALLFESCFNQFLWVCTSKSINSSKSLATNPMNAVF